MMMMTRAMAIVEKVNFQANTTHRWSVCVPLEDHKNGHHHHQKANLKLQHTLTIYLSV